LAEAARVAHINKLAMMLRQTPVPVEVVQAHSLQAIYIQARVEERADILTHGSLLLLLHIHMQSVAAERMVMPEQMVIMVEQVVVVLSSLKPMPTAQVLAQLLNGLQADQTFHMSQEMSELGRLIRQ
jgi:hypothetical protein